MCPHVQKYSCEHSCERSEGSFTPSLCTLDTTDSVLEAVSGGQPGGPSPVSPGHRGCGCDMGDVTWGWHEEGVCAGNSRGGSPAPRH